jgi:hypothetical protein
MPNWDSIEQSFLSLSRQKQLGELASSLARLKSWSLTDKANNPVVSVVLGEAVLYTSLMERESGSSEFTQLQKFLQDWRISWSNAAIESAEFLNMNTSLAKWSDRVLDMSGLLQVANIPD